MNFFSWGKINFKRMFRYAVGLFVMNIGIALSIKSNLGSTPVVAVPYAISLITSVDFGYCNMIFQGFLVLVELILLGRAFKPKYFLQFFVGVILGIFTSLSMFILSFLPLATSLTFQIIFLISGIVLFAFGLLLYVPMNAVPVSVDGVTQALAILTNQSFAKTKIIFDISMISISLIVLFTFTGHINGGVGIGTIIAAVSIGATVKLINIVHAKISGNEADLKKM